MQTGDHSETAWNQDHAARWAQPLAVAVVLGVVLGRLTGWFWPWLLACLPALLLLWVEAGCGRRKRWGTCALLAVTCVSAAWTVLSSRAVLSQDGALEQMLSSDGSLVRVRGVVADAPRLAPGTPGRFEAFGFDSPATHFELAVDEVSTDRGDASVHGRLLVKIDSADPGIEAGQRIEAVGWASLFDGPRNPADFDFRSYALSQGVVGRMGLDNAGNWRLLEEPGLGRRLWGPASWLQKLRAWAADRSRWSLGLGLEEDAQVLGLLQTLLLGQTGQDIDAVRDRFRSVGLAHVLSISGAHLGILMGMIWMLSRVVVTRPSRAGLLTLAVLGLYLMAVPLRVPIVRASVMAGVFFVGVSSGRHWRGTTLLSLALVLVLVWRPGDLFDAGFQLSFVTVWALLRFVPPVSLAILPEPIIKPTGPPTQTAWLSRWLADFAAVSLVAFLTAMPLVAYHFQMVNPLSLVLSGLALPGLTMLLGLGYLKIAAGLALPSVSLVLSGPLRWLTSSLTGLVDEASRWPMATVGLRHALPMWWPAAAVGVGWLWMGGWFARRRVAGVLAALLLLGYLVGYESPTATGRWLRHGLTASEAAEAEVGRPVAWLNMVAVGDGSCYLLRVRSDQGVRTLMFDCGSQTYPLIGRRSVVPTLASLGVDQIDLLLLSHADMDHYNGVLDVIDAVPVGEVWVSPDLIAEASVDAKGATAFLLSRLEEAGHAWTPVTRGHRWAWGSASLQLLWPAEGWRAKRNNDNSLVLSAEVAGRRLLLNGDIQQEAITALLESGEDLSADVADLPHHGSFVDASVAWLDAVSPTLLLQSSGPARLRNDKWAVPLRDRPGVQRLVSHYDGQVGVVIGEDGRMAWWAFAGATGSASP